MEHTLHELIIHTRFIWILNNGTYTTWAHNTYTIHVRVSKVWQKFDTFMNIWSVPVIPFFLSFRKLSGKPPKWHTSPTELHTRYICIILGTLFRFMYKYYTYYYSGILNLENILQTRTIPFHACCFPAFTISSYVTNTLVVINTC